MSMMENSIKARYQVNQNIFITCYLEVMEASSQAGLKAQIGIRIPGDTIVPVGTKLYLATEPAKTGDIDSDSFELFYSVVQGIEIFEGIPVQCCSPIYREQHQNRRSKERMPVEFSVQLKEMGDQDFQVIEATPGGLTLRHKFAGTLSGLLIDHAYHFDLRYKDLEATLTGHTVHLQYDWHHHVHHIGLKLLNLTPTQENMLSLLIDPKASVDITQKSLVDAEEFRIRPDLG